MQTTNAVRETAKRIGSSATFKLITICALILVLLVPTSMVTSLIHERKIRKQGVIDEINYKWGQAQSITGPIISVPYLEHIGIKNGKTTRVTKYIHILPDTVDIKSHITPTVRYRGIYEAILYNTTFFIPCCCPSPSRPVSAWPT